jgi:RNA polymerase sigma-70 factor (ECF subfamily)
MEEGVGDRMDDERRMRWILIMFSHLKAKEREVIALCDWSGLSYAEAASALHIPIGTVRSRLFRAREHLRSLLAGTDVQNSPAQLIELKSAKDAHDSL